LIGWNIGTDKDMASVITELIIFHKNCTSVELRQSKEHELMMICFILLKSALEKSYDQYVVFTGACETNKCSDYKVIRGENNIMGVNSYIIH